MTTMYNTQVYNNVSHHMFFRMKRLRLFYKINEKSHESYRKSPQVLPDRSKKSFNHTIHKWSIMHRNCETQIQFPNN